MTKAATRSIGTKFKIGTNFIGDLSSIGSPSETTEEIDVTTLDSPGGVREFIAGFTDPGEVPISGFFVPSDLGQADVRAAMKSKEIKDFEIIYPASLGVTWTFQGYVSAFTVTTETEEAIGFEATIRVSGESDINYGTSTGLSGLSLSGTGGTLSPTFANGTQYYTYDGVSASSVTVTATAANHSLKLYVDGVYSQDLTSGAASSSISLTLNVGKKLTILAQETGKAPVAYEIVVVKKS
ncbi:MAG: histidine kinase [Cohnella sp.]|nr:histidine kinase [Cohnella sp.]